jgi:hypothetical protein
MGKNELLFEHKRGKRTHKRGQKSTFLQLGGSVKVAIAEHQLSALGRATWGRTASWKTGLMLRKPLPRSPISLTEGTRHSNSTERSGNVYENKGSRPKTSGQSWNLYENTGA